MSQDDNGFGARSAAAIQPPADQQAADSAPLELRANGHGPESYHTLGRGEFHGNGREEDVAHDCLLTRDKETKRACVRMPRHS